MSRPCKSRKVCALPPITAFGPSDQSVNQEGQIIYMSIDEFEALRLIDYEEMTQEQCAFQMNIARTTAQKIYNSGRKKLIEMLVTGADLNIRGGRITLCGENGTGRHCSRCRRKQGNHHDH